MSQEYANTELTRVEVDALKGAAVIDFGTNWCGFCNRARPLIEEGLQSQTGLRHIKVEDGSGRKLGRSFTIKLWPTLIFMHDGKEVARVVRPTSVKEIREAADRLGSLRTGDEDA